MTQKKETTALLLSLLITVGAIAVGWWWLKPNFRSNNDSPTSTSVETSPSAIALSVSTGEKVLIDRVTSAAKQAGVTAFARGDYEEAVSQLETSLQQKRNDPEALIYLNNARIGDGKAYTIAVSVPIGTNVAAAQEILRGIAQAQNEINSRDGIQGIPLKVAIANDNNEPQTAQKIAQSLAANPEILGVVGHYGSDVTLATAPIYEKQGLVAISAISTSVKLSGAGKYIFRTVPSDRFAGNALARYFLERLNKQKAAVFYNSQSNYSNSLKDVFSTDLLSNGGEIVTEVDLANPNFNPANEVEAAIKQGAAGLILLPNTSTLNQALLVAQVNNGRLPLLAGDGAYSPKTLQVGGKSVSDMVLAVPWHIQGKTSGDFPQAATKLWGGDVNWRTALAYDAARALIAGLETNPSRQGIQQTLSQSDFVTTGASGTIRFLPSGDRNQTVQLVKVKPGKRSGFGYDFVPVN